jgi:hypothetical protein
MVERLRGEVPPAYLTGVVDLEVSPHTVPHPVRGDVYTLGECIPLEWSGSGTDLQSRIVLYHGSFQALARLGDFDWRAEAWETLTHELRHHLEWQADVAGLEAYDWAGEQNFARHEGEPFDPVFYRNGEELAAGVYKVDDDVFIEKPVRARTRKDAGGERVELQWHGRRYTIRPPAVDRRAWVFLSLEGLDEPPPGEAVVVLPARRSVIDLLRRPAGPRCHTVRVAAIDG